MAGAPGQLGLSKGHSKPTPAPAGAAAHTSCVHDDVPRRATSPLPCPGHATHPQAVARLYYDPSEQFTQAAWARQLLDTIQVSVVVRMPGHHACPCPLAVATTRGPKLLTRGVVQEAGGVLPDTEQAYSVIGSMVDSLHDRQDLSSF